jgi:hypothetical protein
MDRKKRKSPVRHRVRSHTRQGRIVNSFVRGKGSRTQKVVNSSPKKLVTKIKEKKFLGKIGGMKVYLANTVKMIYVPLSYQKKLEASHEEVNMDKITRKWNPPKWWIEEEKRTKEKGMSPEPLGYRALFDYVCNNKNWKEETKYVVVKGEVNAKYFANALAYFLGGSEITPLQNDKFMVGSKGYYGYVGS